MYTLGYSFKPWTDDDSIAAGEKIRNYIRETAREYRVEDRIRFGHKVVAAEWSSEEALWTVRAERDGEVVELTCDFFYGCTGYYRYDEGYTPEFAGRERFRGRDRPSPALARGPRLPRQAGRGDRQRRDRGDAYPGDGAGGRAHHDAAALAGLRRHPARPGPDRQGAAPGAAREGRLRDRPLEERPHPDGLLPALAPAPGFTRKLIRRGVERQLPAGYDVDRDFEPKYNPWDERVCLVPGGDLFQALRSGRADVVTDQIETFTEKGLKLASGRELEADVIVTATGLNLLVLGGIEVSVDGVQRPFSELVGYKGAMFGGVPNLAIALGYTNASFTLKCDLVSQYMCRLLNHMDANGYRVATPREPGPALSREPFIDLKSGYVLRSLDQLPMQSETHPWRLHQNYARDIRLFNHGPMDEEMDFARGPAAKAAPDEQSDGVAAVA